MKKLKIFILIGIMIIGLVVLTGCMEVDQNYIDEQSTIQEECEHDWVVTSEFNWFWESYRTVSKCSKCGKVVK